jgi:hypothetical protein
METPLKFDCSQCGQRISATSAEAGKTYPCPTCGHSLEVPTASFGFYVMQGAEQIGPLQESQVKNLIISGHLKLNDQGRREDSHQWMSIGQLMGFTQDVANPQLNGTERTNSSSRSRWKSPQTIAWIAFALSTVTLAALEDSISGKRDEMHRLRGAFAQQNSKEYVAWKLVEAAASTNPFGVLNDATDSQRALEFRFNELKAGYDRLQFWDGIALLAWWLSLLTAGGLLVRSRWRAKRAERSS